MATLSLSYPVRQLIDQTIAHFLAGRVHHELARPRVPRLPEPQPVSVRGVKGDVVVKIASEPDEWEQAFRLVAANYEEAGYQASTEKPFRFTPYHGLPDTTVFVAKRDQRVLATFTLVVDNTVLGLPLDALYADEVAELRRQGRRLAETTCLAVSDLSQREFLQVFLALIQLLQQYHVSRGGDTWVFTVNPRHKNFYCKVLGAEQLGDRKPYAAVGDAPAEAFWLDRTLMRRNAPRGYEQIFGDWLPAAAFNSSPLPRPFVRYFGAESSQTDEARIDDVLQRVAAADNARAW
jgi:hypothetical protein